MDSENDNDASGRTAPPGPGASSDSSSATPSSNSPKSSASCPSSKSSKSSAGVGSPPRRVSSSWSASSDHVSVATAPAERGVTAELPRPLRPADVGDLASGNGFAGWEEKGANAYLAHHPAPPQHQAPHRLCASRAPQSPVRRHGAGNCQLG